MSWTYWIVFVIFDARRKPAKRPSMLQIFKDLPEPIDLELDPFELLAGVQKRVGEGHHGVIAEISADTGQCGDERIEHDAQSPMLNGQVADRT